MEILPWLRDNRKVEFEKFEAGGADSGSLGCGTLRECEL